MRIISGKYKGKKLIAPEGLNTRPTADRTKESLFNILSSLLKKRGMDFENLTILDGFAGSGSIGIEFLSRGAQKAYFVECDSNAINCIKTNLPNEEKDKAEIHRDMLNLSTSSKAVDILFLDPPYKKGLIELALLELKKKNWINDKTIIYVETESKETDFLPEGFNLLNDYKYGKAKISLVQLS
ncbi:MAG: 16S rRNA (guanine(966)-N(2))-methyltransferase RsmD [Alphaproteobacteria bacterium]|nr:16S rRNA (guanine(966)-N(2))-methyltransferase RsmD [Alphaproteobacteria bacterium]